MDFKQFLSVLRRRWMSVVAMLAVAAGVCSVITFVVMSPTYESKSRIILGVDVRDINDSFAAGALIAQRATTYADIAVSTELSDRVIDQLDLDITAAELSEDIAAEVVEGTAIIEITVEADDPHDAQLRNDAVTELFTAYVSELERPGGDDSGASPINPNVTNPASFNPDQVSPRVLLNYAVAAIIGLLLGVALAVARELLDRTIRTADHVAEITDAPVLASIGYDNSVRQSPLLTDLGGFAARTEAFRLLRTNLQFIDIDAQPRCLVISSAVPGEGKTMTATNLAVALAQTGRRTLIIDADLRRPRVATTLGLDPAVGLTTALVGKTDIEAAIQVHEKSGLHVLASGAKPPNPTEILQSKVTQDLIRRLRASYDMVIIDAPPLLPVADASVLSTLADGTIVVIRHAHTTRDQTEEAVNRVKQVGGRLYGVVVNMVAKRAVGSYYYYYYEETSPTSVKGGAKAKSRSSRGGERAAVRRRKDISNGDEETRHDHHANSR